MRHRSVTVGQLKKWLADKADDMCVVVPSFDHSYRDVTFSLADAVWEPDNGWHEHPGCTTEELRTDYEFPDGFKELEVVVVR